MQLKPADVLGHSRVGRALEKRSEPFAAADMTPLRARTELARVHVLNHALTQRGDGIRTHGQLLSWMRMTTPRSSRQGHLHRYRRSLSWLMRASQASPPLSRSDLVLWPTASVASIRLPWKVSGAKLPDSSRSPHLSDIKTREVLRAAAGK